MVELLASVLAQYRSWSLYNSPYTAHDEGCAIDCYPAGDRAPAPVAGRIVETTTVRAPPKPYAPDHDHVIVVDTGDAPAGQPGYATPAGDPPLARILHVDPGVEPGDTVAVGDDLGTLVRAGFFAPWVDNHLHLGFRNRNADPLRATGSLPVEAAVEPVPVQWDGTGTVVETGDTYAVLDAPSPPAEDATFAGIATDDGTAILDGGLPHYDCGGLLSGGSSRPNGGSHSLLGTTIGSTTGRTIHWNDIDVYANGRPITGLSLFVTRDRLGAKLICPAQSFSPGDEVSVEIAADGVGIA